MPPHIFDDTTALRHNKALFKVENKAEYEKGPFVHDRLGFPFCIVSFLEISPVLTFVQNRENRGTSVIDLFRFLRPNIDERAKQLSRQRTTWLSREG